MRKAGLHAFSEDASLRKIEIELVETSGPVSPAYHYTLRIRLYSEGKTIWLDYKETRKKSGLNVQFVTQLESANFEKVLKKLRRLDFVKSNSSVDFVGNARTKVGISFNWLTLLVEPDINLRVDYPLSAIERDDFGDYSKAVNILKKLVALRPEIPLAQA
jgi:hypothetical protein